MMGALSSRSRLLYCASVSLHRAIRAVRNLVRQDRISRTRSDGSLPFPVMEHRSLLVRRLSGTDLRLQENKIAGLRIACAAMDGTLIRPGETFSYWSVVGRPGKRRGFLPGLQLEAGETVERVGGGLCQLSNLLHWMVLHTPMEVTERHRHSFDPFPDYRRTVPFGTGATVFWNYLDLAFRNPGPDTFQVRVCVGEEHLRGEIRSDSLQKETLSVEERGHRFVRGPSGVVYRENSLWLIRRDAFTGKLLSEENIMNNCVQVKYDPLSVPGLEVEDDPSMGS